MNDYLEDFNTKIKREFRTIFHQNGFRISEQRDAIVDIFFATEQHLSVPDIMRELRTRGVEVSESTVRRIMKLLSEYGIAQERFFEGQEVRYEHRHIGEHHDHLICLRCRKIIEFQNSELERIQEYVAHSSGFHPIRHKLELYGICQECFGDQESAVALARAHEGDSFTVMELGGGQHMRNRLESLGMYPGSQGRMIRNRGIGQIIVEVRGARVALGRGISQKVLVNVD